MIRRRPLPYQHLLASRETAGIDLLVIHCTELPDLTLAREYGERLQYPLASQGQPGAGQGTPGKAGGTGNSGHYYIDRDGSIEKWVDHDRVAHHVRGFNPRSIGIELVNLGRYPDWYHSAQQQMRESYPTVQINALILLINQLCLSLPGLRWIAGHEELDTGSVTAADNAALQVRRKMDPGPLFPWQQVLNRCPLQRFKA